MAEIINVNRTVFATTFIALLNFILPFPPFYLRYTSVLTVVYIFVLTTKPRLSIVNKTKNDTYVQTKM